MYICIYYSVKHITINYVVRGGFVPNKKKPDKPTADKQSSQTTAQPPIPEGGLPPIPQTSAIRNIQYLTCQGGGMKGIGFVTAAKELEKHGVLSQLKAVAGSSAGAIFATLVAVGYTAAEIETKMMELDFRELLDKDKTFWDKLPFSKAGEGIGAIADAVKNAADKQKSMLGPLGKAAGAAGSAVKGILAAPGAIATAAKLMVGNETGIAKGEALLDLVSEMITAKTGIPNATFNDLARLADATDGRFKRLILTGSNLTPREGEDRLVYFREGAKYGNMPIRDAVRISAGFPGAFKAVLMQDADGHVNTMVDGGLKENLPDVFNKDPYPVVKGKDGDVNSKCFALSFKNPGTPGEKPKPMKNLKDVALGCLEALTDESPLKKKYGSHLADIDTKGVGTLEFDASAEKRLKLAASGGEAVRKAFASIMEAEKTKPMDRAALDEMAKDPSQLRELVRLEVALQEEDHDEGTPGAAILSDIADILRKLEKTRKEEIEKLRLEERHILKRRIDAESLAAKGPEAFEKAALSDDKLVEYCKNQIVIFNEMLTKYREARDELKVQKSALEFREAEVGAKLKHLGVSYDVETDLKTLEKLQKALKENRDEHASLGLDESAEFKRKALEIGFNNLLKYKNEIFKKIKEKHKDDSLMHNAFVEMEKDSDKWAYGTTIDRSLLVRRLGEDVLTEKLKSLASIQSKIKILTQKSNRKGTTTEDKEKLQKEIDDLVKEREEGFGNLKGEYQGKDEFMVQYLEELEEASKGSPNFEIPENVEDVKRGLHKDVKDCDKDLKEVEDRIEFLEKEKLALDKQANSAFAYRGDISERYKALLNLKQTLDVAIDRTTVPFVEWLAKYVDKKPGRENCARNWGIKVAAGLSCLAWTVGLIAASPVSILGFGVTAVMKKYGNPKMKAAASGVWDWFSWNDPVLYAKTKEMRKLTAECVNSLTDSYGNSIEKDKVVYDNVYMPFAKYFQESGIKIEDLRPKVNEEPSVAKKRIQALNEKIKIIIKKLPEDEKLTFKRFEAFAVDVLKLSKEQRVEKLKQEVTDVEKRFKDSPEKPLTKLEVSKYVAAIKMLEKEHPDDKHVMPKELHEKYAKDIDSIERSPTLLHQLEKMKTPKPAPSKAELEAKASSDKAPIEGEKGKKVTIALDYLKEKLAKAKTTSSETVKPTPSETAATQDPTIKPPSPKR